MMVATKIPTIMITGFLGSGKTTFINELVPRLRVTGAKVAVLINEMGEVNVDRLLINQSDYCAQVNRGSIFCTCVQADLWASLQEVAATNPDVLLMEATGVAAPGQLGGVSYNDKNPCQQMLQVCLVDAGCFYKIAHTLAAARWQATMAQIIIITGSDKATAEQLALTQAELARLNNKALVVEAPYAHLPEPVWQMIIATLVGGKPMEPVADLHNRPIERPRDLYNTQLLHIDSIANAEQLTTVIASLPAGTQRVKGFLYVDGHLQLLQYANGRAELLPAPAAVIDGGYLVVVIRKN